MAVNTIFAKNKDVSPDNKISFILLSTYYFSAAPPTIMDAEHLKNKIK